MTHEQVVGRFAHEVLNEGVFEAEVKPKLDECLQGKVVRYEMKYTYPEVGERDLLVSYFPIEGANGIDRAVCILQDITGRKQMEEALSGMTRKLIESQEQERSRIGRELHDDINQISDSGRGFDVESALQGKGLGLMSMRERVRLVNGTIAIESNPMAGTTIHVRVPFGSEHSAQRAAG